MPQSPGRGEAFAYDGGYANAARQLNKLVRAGRSYSGHERNCCFMNVEGKRFANVSMLSGFDFLDDGRAVALCDWDADGDQDIWVANRTAPQLRLLRNDWGNDGRYIAFQLEGTSSNRDAIGARIRIHLDLHGEPTVLQRTLRVGEGFLACHSKVVHFGLGDASRVDSVEVQWPVGNKETFGPISLVDRRYALTEGTGQMRPLTTAPVPALPTVDIAISEQTFATQNLLTEPAPLPPLVYQSSAGGSLDAAVPHGQPTLLTLWATWCQPCLVELADWSRQAPRFAEENLQLLAICVDDPSREQPNSDPRDILQRMDFRGQSGSATAQLLDALQLLHNVVYDHHRPLPIPTSFLLDQDGRLRAIYKGPVSVDRIMADLRFVREQRPAHEVLPFNGRWLAEQGHHDLSLLVEELFREGYQAEADAYVERLSDPRLIPEQIQARLFLAEQLAPSNPADALRHATAVLELDRNNATAHERLALIFARAGKVSPALHHFRQAILHADPPLARTHFNFGRMLRQSGASEQAALEFTKAIEIDSQLAQAHEQLGLIRAEQREFRQAAQHFQAAIALQPFEQHHHVNLAMAYHHLGQDAAAWNVLRKVVNTEGAPPMAILLAASCLEGLRQYAEAIPLLERFLAIEPSAEDVRQKLAVVKEALHNELAAGQKPPQEQSNADRH